MQPIRARCRLARRLHAIYSQRQARHEQDQRAYWQRLQRRYEEAEHCHHLMEKAQARGWRLAARHCQEQFAAVLRLLNDAVAQTRGILAAQPPSVPDVKDLAADLFALDTEFVDVTVNAAEKTIAVQTEPIVLKDIPLGRFQIQLHWSHLARGANVECFEIVALDPNPAASDDSVTHPHVRDQRLCAGDATVPLQKALEQGRLADAFCLIRSVLETYNAGSPHVRLDDWGGITCWNCSSTTDADDIHFCERCEHDVCSDCTDSCQHCGTASCRSCQSQCEACHEPCCPRCLTSSARSETLCCKDCLKECASCGGKVASNELDDDERCPECQEPEPDLDEVDQPISFSPSTGESS